MEEIPVLGRRRITYSSHFLLDLTMYRWEHACNEWTKNRTALFKSLLARQFVYERKICRQLSIDAAIAKGTI